MEAKKGRGQQRGYEHATSAAVCSAQRAPCSAGWRRGCCCYCYCYCYVLGVAVGAIKSGIDAANLIPNASE